MRSLTWMVLMSSICLGINTEVGDYDPATDPRAVFGSECMGMEQVIDAAGSDAGEHGPFGVVCTNLDAALGRIGTPYRGWDWCAGKGVWTTEGWNYRVESGAECANFGGQWVVRPLEGSPDPNGFGQHVVFLYTPGYAQTGGGTEGFDEYLVGRETFWRLNPMRGKDAYGFFEHETNGELTIGFDYSVPEGWMYIWMMDWETFEDGQISYDPDGDEAWVRWTIDPGGMVRFWTAPFCGQWTERMSAQLNPADFGRGYLVHHMQAYEGGVDLEPGSLSRIFTGPYAEPESP